MKRIVFTLLFVLMVIVAVQAQMKKGNIMMGANLSNISFGLDKPNVFRLDVNPKAAYFVQDGVAFGVDLSFGLATSKGMGTDINYGVGALARYYADRRIYEVVKNGLFFGEATVGISGVNPAAGGNTNGLGFSMGPGFSYFITNSIGLEALLKYNGVVGFGSSLYGHTLGLNIGFQVYLPGRKTAGRFHN
jgi:hypothetical protein